MKERFNPANPFDWSLLWLSFWTPESRTERIGDFLAAELREDIEMLEEHGMSLWERS